MTGLGETDAGNEETAPPNGAAPDIRISWPKGKTRGAKADVEGQAELDALRTLGGKTGYTVNRDEGPPGWPPVPCGIIRVRLVPEDMHGERLCAKLGGGTFSITAGKETKTISIVEAPKDFGGTPPPPQQQWVMTPQGPMSLGQAGGPPMLQMHPGMMYPYAPPAPQQDLGAVVAKALGEALKPIFELFGKKNDDGASKFALEVEKTKLEIAREESKARAAEATEARKIREAEIKANADTEGKRLERQAEAQVKAAEALAKAQSEMAQAQIKSAESRAKSEEGQVDRFFKWQEKLAPKESPMSEMLAIYKAINGIAAKPSATVEILDGLSKLVPAVGAEVHRLATALPALSAPAGAAPVQNPPPQAPPTPDDVAKFKAALEGFMSVVRTVRTAIREKKTPEQTVNLLNGPGGAPSTIASIGKAPPDMLLKNAEEAMKLPETLLPASGKAEIAELMAFIATDEGRAWFGTFYVIAQALAKQ